MILAGIDIGTNTLRLLVAEIRPDSFRELHSERIVTRLGQDLERTGRLSRESMDRALSALNAFASSIGRHAAKHIAAIGTSALRNAQNAADFIAEAKKKTGIAITVIPGEEEARLTLLGAVQAVTGATDGRGALPSAMFVDIGGGSTELIVTHPARSPKVSSLPLGAVYLTERFFGQDPLTKESIQALRGAIRGVLDEHADPIPADPDAELIGTAGTITTLAAMDQRLTEYDPDRINRYRLSRTAVKGMVERLSGTTLAERRSIPGLERGREDIILAGAVVVEEIMDRFAFPRMLVSEGGLREGIVLDLYRRLNASLRA